ncbi:hypothetical protein GGR57DRAFT_497213 [Xylariaceae sp. FL1272]|nr:hypothetical protein GGR57DRAFT_497213 [Xylariaceae sp. FL1272]
MHTVAPHYPVPSHHSGPHFPLPPPASTPNATLATVTTSATSFPTPSSTMGITTSATAAALPASTSSAQGQQHAAKIAMIAGGGAGVVVAAALLFLVWVLLNRKTKRRYTMFNEKWLDYSATDKAESSSDTSGPSIPDFSPESTCHQSVPSLTDLPAELPATPLAVSFPTEPPQAKLPPPCLYKPLPTLPYDQRISHNEHLGALRATLAGSKVERSMNIFANSWADNVPHEFPDEES